MNTLKTKNPLLRNMFSVDETKLQESCEHNRDFLYTQLCMTGHKVLVVLTITSSILFFFSKAAFTVILPTVMISTLLVDLQLIKYKQYNISNQLNAIAMSFMAGFIALIVPSTLLESLLFSSAMIIMIFQKGEKLEWKTILIIGIMFLSIVLTKILYPSLMVLNIEKWQASVFQISTLTVVTVSVFLSISYYKKHTKGLEKSINMEKKALFMDNIKVLEKKESEFLKEKENLEKKLMLKQNDLESVNANVLVQLQNKKNILMNLEQTLTINNPKSIIQSVIFDIKSQMDTDKKFTTLQENIEDINAAFSTRLISKYPNLTKNDRELCAYIKLGMASKEIAQLRNTTENAINVAKSRLRKKMDLTQNKEIAERLYQL